MLDGATRNGVFWKIILPTSRPIVISTAITSFIAPWVDFIFASVIMKDNYDNYTVAVGLYRMIDRENIYEYYTRFCAGAILVAIPITLLFISIQKYYVEGVTEGAGQGLKPRRFLPAHKRGTKAAGPQNAEQGALRAGLFVCLFARVPARSGTS